MKQTTVFELFCTVFLVSSSASVLVQPRYETKLSQTTADFGVENQTTLEIVCRFPQLTCHAYAHMQLETGCVPFGSGSFISAAAPTYFDSCVDAAENRIFYACPDAQTTDSLIAPFHTWIASTCSIDAIYDSWGGLVPVLEVVSNYAWKLMCTSALVPVNLSYACDRVLCSASSGGLTTNGVSCADQCASLATPGSGVLLHGTVAALRDQLVAVCAIDMPSDCTTRNTFCTHTATTGVSSEFCDHGMMPSECCLYPYGCKPTYDGGYCEHGMCIENFSRPEYFRQCVCEPGYHGERCTVDPDDCIGHACVHGTCVDGADAYTCTCDQGYSGELCEDDADDCIGVECGFGTCDDEFNGFTCVCRSGWAQHSAVTSCDLRVDCDSSREYRHPDLQYCVPCDESCLECTSGGKDGCVACSDPTQTINATSGVCYAASLDCGDACPVGVSPDWWKAVVTLAALYLFLVALYVTGRHTNPEADNSAIVTFGIGFINIVTDGTFAAAVYAENGPLNGFFVVTVVVLCVSAVVNLCMCIYFFITHLKDTHVGHWVESYHSVTAVVVLLSMVSVQALRFAGSHVFNLDALHLQWPNYVIMRVKIVSMITIIIQELPQLVIQVAYVSNRGYVNIVPMVSVLASTIALVYGATSRVFLCLTIIHKGRRVDQMMMSTGIERMPSTWMHASNDNLRGARVSPLAQKLAAGGQSSDALTAEPDQTVYAEQPQDIEMDELPATRARVRSARHIIIDSVRKPAKTAVESITAIQWTSEQD